MTWIERDWTSSTTEGVEVSPQASGTKELGGRDDDEGGSERDLRKRNDSTTQKNNTERRSHRKPDRGLRGSGAWFYSSICISLIRGALGLSPPGHTRATGKRNSRQREDIESKGEREERMTLFLRQIAASV